ncbi:transcription antitermination factor NusB [Lactobacillaceae bacterium L1_55_11]|nr:transcription antitermination factor NusB [Lactobacillaceae bacterium L1_55_11]
MTETTRHGERQAAFQILFNLARYGQGTDRQTVYNLVLGDQQPSDFLNTMVDGVLNNTADLDDLIKPHLKAGWSLKRISTTDLVILRLALYELTILKDSPYKVVVNEAVELAKDFADPEDAKFVNGLLKNFAPET